VLPVIVLRDQVPENLVDHGLIDDEASSSMRATIRISP
jgi:hypothetical protein